MTNQEIGSRIKIAREKMSMNKKELAQRVKVADSTIKRYEDGEINKIKIPVLEAIAKALNVNPMWLIGKSDEMNQIRKSIPLIMEYYNSLNDIGKHEATKRVEELLYIPIYKKHLEVNAAHERTDIELTEEMRKHDDDIMNDENF